MNKTDKKIEEIKHRNFVKIIANVAYGYNGSDPNKPLYKDDGLTYATKTLLENYTPNTEVQKQVEEKLEGLINYLGLEGADLDMAWEYLQTLKENKE